MKKKILFVNHAGCLGGAPRSLVFLISSLPKDKYESIIFNIQKGSVISFFKSRKLKVITPYFNLHGFHGTVVSGMNLKIFIKNYIYLIPNFYYAFKIIKKTKPDILHLNTTCLFQYSFIARIFFPKVKIVTHVREPLLSNFHGNVLKYFNQKLSNSIISINDYESKFFKNSKVIYNFIDTSKFLPIKKDLKNQIIIGFFAKVSEANGVDELLLLSDHLMMAKKDIKIIVFGYEPSSLSESINLKIKKSNKNIIFNSLIKDVYSELSKCHIVYSPFTKPHFSRQIIEAQSCGIPVICSNVESQKNLIVDKKSGFLYNLGDMDKVYNCINIITESEKKYEWFSNNSRNNALKRFNINIGVKNNIKVYNQLYS